MRISDWSSDVCSSDLKPPTLWACPAPTPFPWEWTPSSTGSSHASNPRRAKRRFPFSPAVPHLARGQDRRGCGDGRNRARRPHRARRRRSEEHTSELQSLMRISYAVFCLKKKIQHTDLQDTVDTQL